MAPTPTAQVRIRVPPPPAHLRNPHLWEDALYETAAWSCLEAAISRRDRRGKVQYQDHQPAWS